jgi:sortase A
MMRFLTRLFTLILILGGLGLILYAGYAFLGPDLAYALKTISGTGDLIAPAVNSQPTDSSQPITLPYPRGQGQPGERLVIPRMKLDTRVEEAQWKTAARTGTLYTDWTLPYDAVGHLSNTAQPGEAGNLVISGHNNLVGPNQFGVGLFAGLWDLKPGDPVYVVDAQGRGFEYVVTKSYSLKEEGEPASVREQHARSVLADNGQAKITLITCWNGPVAPLSGNTYRWIVEGDLAGQIDPTQLPAPSQ